MTNPSQRAEVGAPFKPSASAWNTMLDGNSRSENEQVLDQSAPKLVSTITPSCTLLVKNTTAGDLIPGSILTPSAGLGTFPTKPMEVRRRPVASGIAPVDESSMVLVLQDAIRAGEIGVAASSGVTCCMVTVTDANHKYAKPVAGDTAKLVSASSGSVRIMFKEASTGLTLCAVLLQWAAVGEFGRWVKVTDDDGGGDPAGVAVPTGPGGVYAGILRQRASGNGYEDSTDDIFIEKGPQPSGEMVLRTNWIYWATLAGTVTDGDDEVPLYHIGQPHGRKQETICVDGGPDTRFDDYYAIGLHVVEDVPEDA